jgi:hypothetical protein
MPFKKNGSGKNWVHPGTRMQRQLIPSVHDVTIEPFSEEDGELVRSEPLGGPCRSASLKSPVVNVSGASVHIRFD